MLQNKAGLWKSSDLWKFTSNEDWIRIENINKKKVWGTTNDGKVILENFEEDKDGQLWKEGDPNSEGYFTLENYKVSKFLTASSSINFGDLEPVLDLKGNITLRWIPPTS